MIHRLHGCAFSAGKFNGRAVIVRFAHNLALAQRPYKPDFNFCNHSDKFRFIGMIITKKIKKQGNALQNTYYELASNKVLRNKEIFDFVLFREVLITSQKSRMRF